MEELTELSTLLRRAIQLYEEDRAMAVHHYDDFKHQLARITMAGFEMSEECKMEKEVNTALSLVFKSGERLDSVIQTISKVIIQQLNNENRKEVATIISSGGDDPTKKKIINSPVDIKNLLSEGNKEIPE
jgi:hypothetical protein